MSEQLHETTVTVTKHVKHRFAPGDRIRYRSGPVFTIEDVDVNDDGDPIYRFVGLPRNPNDTISYYDDDYQLVQTKKVRVYTITVEVPDRSNEGYPWMPTKSMANIVGDRLASYALPYVVTDCTSTTEEREV